MGYRKYNMEKLSEITLGRKGWVIKFGSVFIIMIMGLILYLGLYKIELPQYADVEIVVNEENLFLVSDFELNSPENIELENNKTLLVDLQKIGIDKYQLHSCSFSETTLQNLRTNIITKGRILIAKENLFESLLPFW